MDLIGKTALITGSGVRLGKAIALALLQEKCNLALHYNNSIKGVNEVIDQADTQEVTLKAFQADLTNENQLKKMVDQIISVFGHFDILINNAGIYLPGRGLDTTSKMLVDQFQLNLFAPLLLTQKFAGQLPEGHPGRVINISDAKVFRHQTDHFAYRLTKSALNEMTMLMALELAGRDITVNAIAPGIMLPLAGYEHIDVKVLADKRIPLRRIGSPEIIAENVLHILRQEFMTGSIIRIDGGEAI